MRSGIESQWKEFSRSQSTSKDPKSTLYAEPRQTLATRHMEYVWTTGKRFWVFFLHLIRPKIIIRNSLFCNTRCYRIGSSAGTLTSGTIPMPTLARGPSTMSSLFPVDIPQNSMVGQQRQQKTELEFDKFPTPTTFLCRKIRFKNQVTTCSDFPSEALLWVEEAEIVDSSDDLKSSRSIAVFFRILRCWMRETLLF